MGEHFMRNNDPGAACAGFIKTVHELTIEKHIDE
jgi:hypothetical protein